MLCIPHRKTRPRQAGGGAQPGALTLTGVLLPAAVRVPEGDGGAPKFSPNGVDCLLQMFPALCGRRGKEVGLLVGLQPAGKLQGGDTDEPHRAGGLPYPADELQAPPQLLVFL